MQSGFSALRVFLSHTSELARYPSGASYVAAAKAAVMAAGHVPIDMAEFESAPGPSADLCVRKVKSCQVYLGVLGTQYGSPVLDRPELSYTELEFETATAAGLDRLVFMLDTDTPLRDLPAEFFIDLQYGARQEAFRSRVRGGDLTVQVFDSPAKLGQLVERSLRALNAEVAPGAGPPHRTDLILSPRLAARYRPGPITADRVAALLAELSTAGTDDPATARRQDDLDALRLALTAKKVFQEFRGATISRSRLHMIFLREVGRWPHGNSVDEMLVEAAGAHIRAQRHGKRETLGPLTRFLVGTSAEVEPDESSLGPLDHLAGELGDQAGDARELWHRRRNDGVAWLLVDFGPEPQPGARPTALTWWYFCPGEPPMAHSVDIDDVPDGQLLALRDLLAAVPGRYPLLIDFAVPAHLLLDGLDRRLAGGHRNLRLRWSERLHDQRLFEELNRRAVDETWVKQPERVTAELLREPDELRAWLHRMSDRGFFVGEVHSGADRSRALREMLRAGCGFLLWFPDELTPAERRKLKRAVNKVPAPVRREALPSSLDGVRDFTGTVIWDDPLGRAGYPLPRQAAAENI